MKYRDIHHIVLEKQEKVRKVLAKGGEDLNMEEAIKDCDVDGVVNTLNDLNKWNIQLRIWHYNHTVSMRL